ncbi:MAG: hypothetical protein ACYTEZ_11990 [Planctomycetota bacterium]|jgi:hypothetical protein
MRLMSVAVVGFLLLVTALAYYVFVELRPAHLSALVPQDFAFGYFYRSLNELRELYEAPHQRQDVDPARLRLGAPVNNPGLAGVSHREPAGSFVTRDGKEVFLVPCVDVGAFKEAFGRERENLAVRAPHRVAENYLSLSRERVAARRGRENPLVLRATDYPLALAGHPKDSLTFRVMLAGLFVREAPRKPSGVPHLGLEVRKLPEAVGAAVARECDDLLLGFRRPRSGVDPVRVEGEATLSAGSAVARGALLADALDLTGLVATFPFDTKLLVGGVLDGAGWREMGVSLPVGAAALAAGIVEKRHHARRFTLLLAARPRDPQALVRLRESGPRHLVGEADLAFAKLVDGDAEVRTARLAGPPAWLATVLRSDARQAPPVYVSSTVAQGIWYCAVGSQAEGVVRHALGCLRGARELGILRSEPVAAHPEFLAGPHVAVALVTAQGLQAFRRAMPLVELASLGQPPAVTAVLDVDGRARLDLRIAR